MQESSASRNGLLTNQRIIEVDGRNVMGFKVINLSKTLFKSSVLLIIQLKYKSFN